MAKKLLPTNTLLDLCRFGVSLKNEEVDTAARELMSWIVFSSLWDANTELNKEMMKRVLKLQTAHKNPQDFPADMEEESTEQEEDRQPDDSGPQVA